MVEEQHASDTQKSEGNAQVENEAQEEKPTRASRKCSVEFVKEGVFAPRGPTGHSNCRKLRFAMSLFSPFMVMTVAGSSKDIYIEKFGASATTIGALWTVLSIFGVFTGVIHGALQDMQLLSRCFPLSSWGRRAPFFLTHIFLAAGAGMFIYVPDIITRDIGFLYAWFVFHMLIVFWGIGSCITAFECARQEIYPFKEERIIVEGFSKYSAMSGGGAGGLPFLLFSTVSGFGIRLGFSLGYILPLALLSLEAVPVLREAHAAVSGETESFMAICAVLLEAIPFRHTSNRAMQHLMAMAWWDGAYGAIIASLMLYYITYVLQPDTVLERTTYLFVAGATAGLTESVLNLIYMCTFGSGDARKDKSGGSDARLLHFVVCCRVVNALSTALLIGVASPSVLLLIIWSFTCRVGVCGFTFWRISAKCWLVDEDCLSTDNELSPTKRRREGMIFGAVGLTRNLAGAILSSIAVLGLGVAGLKTVNCEERCELLGGDEKSSCEEQCFSEVVHQQPDSLRLYCRFMMGFAAPLCELLLSFHAHKFPIKGVRLRRLYHSVMDEHGDNTYLPEVNPIPVTVEEIVSVAKPHAGLKAGSIMVLGPHKQLELSEDTWQERLARTISAVNKRPHASCAVLFDVTDIVDTQDDANEGDNTICGPAEVAIETAPEEPEIEVSHPEAIQGDLKVPAISQQLQHVQEEDDIAKIDDTIAPETIQESTVVTGFNLGCQTCLRGNCTEYGELAAQSDEL